MLGEVDLLGLVDALVRQPADGVVQVHVDQSVDGRKGFVDGGALLGSITQEISVAEHLLLEVFVLFEIFLGQLVLLAVDVCVEKLLVLVPELL